MKRLLLKSRQAVCVLLCIAVLTTGCAVTTIDVDVYKGPLSNEKSVQIRQAAVMAVGAHRLLAAYQEDLRQSVAAFKSRSKANERAFFSRLEQVRNNVDQVTGLYDDGRADPRLIALVNRAQEAYEKYQKAYELFRPADPKAHEQIREIFARHFAAPAAPDQVIFGKDDPSEKNDVVAFGLLRAGYDNLLVPKQRDGKWVYFDDVIFRGHRTFVSPVHGATTERLSNNEQMKLLATAQFVRDDAARLFTKDTPVALREQFVARVNAIAQAFLDARCALEELLRADLEALAIVSSTECNDCATADERCLLAVYASKLIQPRTLLDALQDIKDAPPAVAALRNHLVKREPNLLDGNNAFFSGSSPDFYDRVQSLVRDELVAHPSESSRALLELHRLALERNPKLANKAWNYGIARGPTVQPNEIGEVVSPTDPSPSAIGQVVERVLETLKSLGSFNRGRLHRGLFATITDYLDKSDGAQDPPETEWLKLKADLVFFAQKLLSLSYGEALIDAQVDSPTADIKEVSAKVDIYHRLLQSIGNSILVQINELEAMQSHADRDGARGRREADAIAARLPRNARGLLDRQLQDIQQERVALTDAGARRTRDIAQLVASATSAAKEAEEENDAVKTAADAASIAASVGRGHRARAEERRDAAKQARDAASRHTELAAKAPANLIQLRHDLRKQQTLQGEATAKQTEIEADMAKDEPSRTRLQPDLDKVKQEVEKLTAAITALNSKIALIESEQRLEAAKAEAETKRAEAASQAADQADVDAGTADTEKARAEQQARDHRTKASEAQARATAQSAEADALRQEAMADAGLLSDLTAASAVLRHFLRQWSPADLDAASTPDDVQARVVREVQQAALDPNIPPAPTRPPGTSEQLAAAAKALLARPVTTLTAQQVQSSAESPRDVLDAIVATYEAEYRNAVKSGGKESLTARKIREAIDATEAYRASKVFIRPPAAFLKSSDPITSLQEGTETRWKNMLLEKSFRAIPFWDRVGSEQNAQLRKQLDRQSWQNINRVRVSSNGITNYVMVKDDIGNWYVKSFSGNPEPIIKAAKATALYAASARTGVDLIAQDRRRAQALAAGNEPPAAPESGEAFRSKVGAFQSRYEKTTRSHISALAGNVDAMRDTLVQAWESDEDVKKLDLPNRTLKTADQHLGAAKDALKSPADASVSISAIEGNIGDALEHLLRYQQAILDNLAGLPKPDVTKLEEKKTELKSQEAKQARAIEQLSNDQATLRIRESEAAAARADLATAVSEQAGMAATNPARPAADAKVAATGIRLDRANEAVNAATTALNTSKVSLEAETKATTAVRDAVAAEQAAVDKQITARATARKIVAVRVGGTVTDFSARRIEAVKEYQTAVQVVLQSQTEQVGSTAKK